MLTPITLDRDVVSDHLDIAGGSANLTTAELAADQNKRSITKGTTDVLTFVVEKSAGTNPGNHADSATCGTTVRPTLP